MPVYSSAWIKNIIELNSNGAETVPSIASDSSGNIYIAYLTTSTVSGGTSLNPRGNLVLAKVNSAGTLVWVKQYASLNALSTVYAPSLVVDSVGTLYISYYADSPISGQSAAGAADVILAKVDTNGNVLWTIQNIISTTASEYNPAIAIDSNGNSYITYYTYGTVSGGTFLGNGDIVIAKINSGGILQWIKSPAAINTSSFEIYPSIASDAVGNTYIAYRTDGTVSGGTQRGGGDIVLVKLDTSGNVLWVNQNIYLNTIATDERPNIVTDSSGNLYIVYSVGSTPSGGIGLGNGDTAVAKINASGIIQWIREVTAMNTASSDNSPRIAIDPSGNVAVVYYTTGTISGGTNSGFNDIVMYSLAGTDGALQWTKQQAAFNTTNEDQNPSITIDSQFNIIVAYQSIGIISGGTPSLGPSDIILHKQSVTVPSIPSNVVVNDIPSFFGARVSWTNQGFTYNVYRDTSSSGATKTLLGTVTNVSIFNDITLSSFGTYYYFVNAVNGSYTSGFSTGVAYEYREALAWLLESPILNTTTREIIPTMAIDADNNLYIAYHRGSAAPFEIVLAKINSNGTILWVTQDPRINTSLDDYLPSIATDSFGNIYVAYMTNGTVSGGTSSGDYDIAIAKLNSDSQIQWVIQHPFLNSSLPEYNPYITTDVSGNVYITYNTNGIVSGGTNSGTTDTVVAKMSANGSILWIKQLASMNTSESDYTPTIVIDGSGNIYGGIESNGSLVNPNIGLRDITLFKMDTNGNLLWLRQPALLNTTADDYRPVVCLDRAGAIYLAYHTTGVVSGGVLLGQSDIVIAKIDISGNTVWIKQYPTINSTLDEFNVYIKNDSYGNIYLTYVTRGTISGGLVNTTFDVCITKIDTNGQLQWIKQASSMNTTGNENVPYPALDNFGNVYVAYHSSGTVSGGTYLGGPSDIVLAKIVQPPVTASLPSAPLTIAATQLGVDTIVQWSPPANNANNAIILEYTVVSNPDGITTKVNGSLLTANITGLVTGRTYTFSVSARNAVGTGPSGISNAITFYRTPSQPTNVVAYETVSQQALVTWSPPSSVGDSALVSYIVIASPGGATTTVGAGTTGVTIIGLTNGTSYTFTVIASNSYGLGYPSTASNSVTPSTVPNAPTSITGTSLNTFYGSILVSWTPGFNGGAPVAYYIVRCVETQNAYKTSNTLVNFTDLDIRKTYTFTVYAVNKNGNSPLSTPSTQIYPSRELFLLKWIKQSSPFNTISTESSPKLVTDLSGNSYIAYTGGSVSGGIGVGQADIIIVKFNTYGNIVWLKQHTAMNSQLSESSPVIAVDGSGNVYLSYSTTGTISGGTYMGNGDIVVAKLNSSGSFLWAREYALLNTTLQEMNPRIDVDSTGNIYLAYATFGTLSGGTLLGDRDIAVSKLDTNGNIMWIKQYGSMNSYVTEDFPNIKVNGSDIYVCHFTGSTTSGNLSFGGFDIVVTKLDTNGNIIWMKQNATFNTSGLDWYPSMALDPSGNVYVTYYTSGTVSGGTFLGNYDIAVFKLDSSGNTRWVKQIGTMNTTGTDAQPTIIADISGNSYVAYATGGTVSGGTFLGGTYDIAIAKFNPDGILMWVKQEFSFNTTATENDPSIGVDANGSIYITYYTQGTVSSGSNEGNGDIVIMKISQIPPQIIMPNNIVLPAGNSVVQAHGSVRITGV